MAQNEKQQQEKLELIKDSIKYLENRGYTNIKAEIDGYESPKGFQEQNSELVIAPHIVGERAGVKHYFNMSLKTENEELLRSKWKFFETITSMRQQRFNVFTKRGHFKFTEEMLDSLNLQKDYIKL